MNKSISIPSVKVIQEIIDHYFETFNVAHKASVRVIGMDIWIDVQYTDYLPTRRVRQDLERLFPQAIIDTIERTYSDRARNQAAAQFFGSDEAVYFKSADGTFHQVHPTLILEHILCDQELNCLQALQQE